MRLFLMGPFHEGELAVQRRAGVAANAERIGRIIRREIPEAARAFAAAQRFVILGAADAAGRVWATLLQGEPGFLSAPTEELLRIDARPPPGDPLAESLGSEADVGLLVIHPATRRRMRVNGRSHPREPNGLEIATREVYSNCHKYIRPREVGLPRATGRRSVVQRGGALTPAQAAWLAVADTLFIASRHPRAGADVSHRGGPPGFVRVSAPDRLVIPDYPGNMMFNTLGNLAADPRAGLLLVDFDGGGTLQLTGRAAIHWDPAVWGDFPGAERLVELRIDEVVASTSQIGGSAPLVGGSVMAAEAECSTEGQR
ncbi:MAG TPA: pyridoxamine 5'-phosphate oxidase family protein [Gemmatimonadales bacterium]|nr:pyridoxamine 5'-phosphate oxidase family protein [Gemmatimonadales bacterium]